MRWTGHPCNAAIAFFDPFISIPTSFEIKPMAELIEMKVEGMTVVPWS